MNHSQLDEYIKNIERNDNSYDKPKHDEWIPDVILCWLSQAFRTTKQLYVDFVLIIKLDLLSFHDTLIEIISFYIIRSISKSHIRFHTKIKELQTSYTHSENKTWKIRHHLLLLGLIGIFWVLGSIKLVAKVAAASIAVVLGLSALTAMLVDRILCQSNRLYLRSRQCILIMNQIQRMHLGCLLNHPSPLKYEPIRESSNVYYSTQDIKKAFWQELNLLDLVIGMLSDKCLELPLSNQLQALSKSSYAVLISKTELLTAAVSLMHQKSTIFSKNTSIEKNQLLGNRGILELFTAPLSLVNVLMYLQSFEDFLSEAFRPYSSTPTQRASDTYNNIDINAADAVCEPSNHNQLILQRYSLLRHSVRSLRSRHEEAGAVLRSIEDALSSNKFVSCILNSDEHVLQKQISEIMESLVDRGFEASDRDPFTMKSIFARDSDYVALVADLGALSEPWKSSSALLTTIETQSSEFSTVINNQPKMIEHIQSQILGDDVDSAPVSTERFQISDNENHKIVDVFTAVVKHETIDEQASRRSEEARTASHREQMRATQLMSELQSRIKEAVIDRTENIRRLPGDETFDETGDADSNESIGNDIPVCDKNRPETFSSARFGSIIEITRQIAFLPPRIGVEEDIYDVYE